MVRYYHETDIRPRVNPWAFPPDFVKKFMFRAWETVNQSHIIANTGKIYGKEWGKKQRKYHV